MQVGMRANGLRFWVTGDPTPAEQAGIKRYKEVDELCGKMMKESKMHFNAAWRSAVHSVVGVLFAEGTDFRLQYPREEKKVRKRKDKS